MTMIRVVLAAALAAATPAFAEETESFSLGSWRFGAGVSTSGPTIEASYRVNDFWAIRGFHGFGITDRKSKTRAGITYSEFSELKGTSLSVDLYPFRNRFRVSAGGIYKPAEYRGRASGTLEVGSNIYSTTLGLKIETDPVITPYVALGYEWPLSRRVTFVSQIGAVYVESVNVTLTNLGGDTVSVSDIGRERAQIGDAFDKVQPFASFSLMVQF